MNTQLHNYLASTHEVYKTIWGKLSFPIHSNYLVLHFFTLRFIPVFVGMDAIVNVLLFKILHSSLVFNHFIPLLNSLSKSSSLYFLEFFYPTHHAVCEYQSFISCTLGLT